MASAVAIAILVMAAVAVVAVVAVTAIASVMTVAGDLHVQPRLRRCVLCRRGPSDTEQTERHE